MKTAQHLRPRIGLSGRNQFDQARLLRWLDNPPKRGGAKLLHDAMAAELSA